jgi:hypothetical protein
MSAPSEIKRLQTSTRDFDAASCKGENDHKSEKGKIILTKISQFDGILISPEALTFAPALMSS